MTQDLRQLPAIRALAEERARSRVQMFADIEGEPCAPDGDVATVANVELALLADLSRPDSRDALVRLVERFGDASDADRARHHRDNPGELEALALAVLA